MLKVVLHDGWCAERRQVVQARRHDNPDARAVDLLDQRSKRLRLGRRALDVHRTEETPPLQRESRQGKAQLVEVGLMHEKCTDVSNGGKHRNILRRRIFSEQAEISNRFLTSAYFASTVIAVLNEMGARMKITTLVPAEGDCNDGKTCPAVHVTDGDLVLVQGYVVPEAPLTPPAGEALVAVPKSLLRSLATQLGEL